jgi:hypothetical protein
MKPVCATAQRRLPYREKVRGWRFPFKESGMKITIFAAAVLLATQGVIFAADGDEAAYNQRAAQTDMSLFRELAGTGNDFLTREGVRGDMRLGPRFDDIDTNRDEIVTQQEMRIYIERKYGVLATPG